VLHVALSALLYAALQAVRWLVVGRAAGMATGMKVAHTYMGAGADTQQQPQRHTTTHSNGTAQHNNAMLRYAAEHIAHSGHTTHST
jgi:membrane protease subunit (stomatin/prohibitin family)